MPPTATSIIDNRDGNTLQLGIENITEGSRSLSVATAFFSLDALAIVAGNLHGCDSVRILFGHESDRTQRAKLLQRLREQSDADLAERRLDDPTLSNLAKIDALFKSKRIQARCYTARKFHAKAYLAERSHYPNQMGILGSGNFTSPGLTRNIELNVVLTPEQTAALSRWYEERWEEAVDDDVTAILQQEIKRQIDLYDPYAIYQRALLAWGDHYQGGIAAEDGLRLKRVLDPHQALGYRRALEILDREHGVLVCDGVGLGKSFIALALMEQFCRRKKNVLLIAPKNILESSWNSYLEEFLGDFRQPFGTIYEKAMTDLAFDADEESPADSSLKKQRELEKLIERVDVVVVDESHNFRTTSTQRYGTLKRIAESLSPVPGERKKVILLTATPINTRYQDLSAQLALISQEHGSLAGFDTARINAAARQADAVARKDEVGQLALDFDGMDRSGNEVLRKVLEATTIQRKRTTCIELARAVGKDLAFPIREAPTQMEYELSDSWKSVVRLSHKRFAPTAAFLKAMREEYKKAEAQKVVLKPTKLPGKSAGIKFAAFLPEQYRIAGDVGRRDYQTEVLLAGLVFTNTLKQLESSPAAFQGILQSLGTSLLARLRHVFGALADQDIEPHSGWVNTPINALALTDGEADEESGANADLNGEELDEWLEKAISGRHLHKKLDGFTADCFDVQKWRTDILNDLSYLRDIHRETVEARQLADFKLLKVKEILRDRLNRGQRVVVFTQSQRTSFYLEKTLIDEFPQASIARIDSNVKQETRADILHAFCPNYNPRPKQVRRERVDILICTDVLSEGVNMQEAECILNYDIHWNPVRLIQRIGRVDRRLDPQKNPVPHSFSIVNCFPPDDINDIIKLVDTVEQRTTRISRTVGIDQAFFKATDPAGTLKEFNSAIDGEPTAVDRANERYVSFLADPDRDIRAEVEQMPPGAFGVWERAPINGVFALFAMAEAGKDALSDSDRARSRAVLGMPVLALETAGKIGMDAAEILEVLSATVKGKRSGNPGDPNALKESLQRIKQAINQSFRSINLVAGIQPKLVCWMELRA